MEKTNGRDVILKAAAKIFADKGYEGARVDEIAKEANVTKSLLYYHFKSKSEIFDVLVENLLVEYGQLMSGIGKEQVSYESNQLKKRVYEKIFPFGLENEDLVRCAFIESLKREKTCTVFYQMVEMQKDTEDTKEMGKLVLEYFFNILPCIVFLCQKESWSSYFQVNQDELGKVFLEQYDRVHGSYHRSNSEK